MAFEPSLSKIFNFLLEITEWLKETINDLKSCEADLVPFIELEKTPIFCLDDNITWFKQYKNDIIEMIE